MRRVATHLAPPFVYLRLTKAPLLTIHRQPLSSRLEVPIPIPPLFEELLGPRRTRVCADVKTIQSNSLGRRRSAYPRGGWLVRQEALAAVGAAAAIVRLGWASVNGG